MVFVEAKYFVNIIIMSAVRFNLTFVNDAQKHFQIRYRYLVNVWSEPWFDTQLKF